MSNTLDKGPPTNSSSKRSTKSKSRLHDTLRNWLDGLPAELLQDHGIGQEHLVSEFPSGYVIYGPMLVLPARVFQGPSWSRLIRTLDESQVTGLYESLAFHLGVSHIAANAPIPSKIGAPGVGNESLDNENVIRRPINFKPLYGAFGSLVNHEPKEENFKQAFWVTARQNGIAQVWAPLYTMFSRGNIKEKARLLELQSIRQAADEGKEDGHGWAAVDLYAGVGYFAFSYAKAGASKVLCWELNPWSVEGLRRGAVLNRWGCKVLKQSQEDMISGIDVEEKSSCFYAFQESNVHALKWIESFRERLPPIRHVNCGLLPSSSPTWELAVLITDPRKGGWIHIHENLDAGSVEEQAQDIVSQIRRKIERPSQYSEGADHGPSRHGCGHEVVLEHVEVVKAYAPRILHCVLDIHVRRA